MKHILITQYETNPPQYDQAVLEKILKFDLDLFSKVTEVILEVKLAENA